MTHTTKFISRGRKAQCEPDPNYPDGKDIDTGQRPACKFELPYPAECVGAWHIKCDECGCVVVVTTAGRPDDPRSVAIPCKRIMQ